MLDARAGIVPFSGRVKELRGAATWLTEGPARSVRLWHGPMGEGKTRLALEVAHRALDLGWKVLEAEPTPGGPDHAATRVSGREASSPGLLLLVDEADRWPGPDLEAAIRHTAGLAGDLHYRVLLLSRSRSWLPSINQFLVELDASPEPSPIVPWAAKSEERQLAYDAAFAAFTSHLGTAAHVVTPDLTGDAFDRIQVIHMAALAAVLAKADGETAPLTPDAISKYLLTKERAYWQRWAIANGGGRTSPQDLARAVGLASLVGPQPFPAAISILRRWSNGTDDGPARRLLDDHLRFYPASEGDVAMEPLVPDRLAEDFVGLMVSGHEVPDVEADPWFSSTLATCGGLFDELDRAAATRFLTRLADVAERWPHVLSRVLIPLLDDVPDRAARGGSRFLEQLAKFDRVPADLLNRVRLALPDQEPAIAPGARWIAESCVKSFEKAGLIEEPEGALALLDLGLRLFEMDDVEPSVEILERGCRLLSPHQARDGATWIALVMGLCNLGMAYFRAGRSDEAVRTLELAIEPLQHQWEENEAAAFVLAGALASLSMIFSAEDHQEDACAVQDDVITIYRRLRDAWPENVSRNESLVNSLNNQAVILSRLGYFEEALEVMREALDLVPTGDNTSRQRSTKARLLLTLGSVQAERHQPDDAIRWTREAIRILRGLVDEGAVTLRKSLGQALTNLGSQLREIGDARAAVIALAEAVEILELELSIEAASVDSLGKALLNLGNARGDLSLAAEAMSAYRRAADYYQDLVTRAPSYEPELALVLTGLAAKLGQAPEADVLFRRAFEIYERANEHNPGRWREPFVGSLWQYALSMIDGERADEAQRAAERAVHLARQVAEHRGPVADSDLAVSLAILAMTFALQNNDLETVSMARQSITLWKQVLTRDDAPEPTSARGSAVLLRLGAIFARTGRRSDAIRAFEVGVDLLRQLNRSDPILYSSQLSNSLVELGAHRAALGDRVAALADADEAVAVQHAFRGLAGKSDRSALGKALSARGVRLRQLDRNADAVRSMKEALAIFLGPDGCVRSADRYDVAATRGNLAAHEAEHGDPETAVLEQRTVVAEWQSIVAGGDSSVMPQLITARLNLSAFLTGAGAHAEADSSLSELLDWLPSQASVQPREFRQLYAHAARNLAGVRLVHLNDPVAAEKPAGLAVSLLRVASESEGEKEGIAAQFVDALITWAQTQLAQDHFAPGLAGLADARQVARQAHGLLRHQLLSAVHRTYVGALLTDGLTVEALATGLEWLDAADQLVAAGLSAGVDDLAEARLAVIAAHILNGNRSQAISLLSDCERDLVAVSLELREDYTARLTALRAEV